MKVIFDTDPGVDDAMALYYALAHPSIEVVGITTVFGNVTVTQATTNALYLCGLTQCDAIPVAAGAARPLHKTPEAPPAHIHGSDGLGNLPQRDAVIGCAVEKDAADFLIAQVRANPHAITLVAVGPLTNLATALARDTTWAALVKRVVIMGGAVSVPGNVTATAEANIWNDPHAAQLVFEAPWQVDVVSLDVTHQVIMPAQLFERLAQRQPHAAMQTLNHAVQFYARYYSQRHADTVGKMHGCFGHDVLAFMALTDPALFQTLDTRLGVTTAGPEAGRTVQLTEGPARHTIYTSVDSAGCVKAFEATLAANWLG